MDIEDNVGDSTIKRLWNQAHSTADSAIIELNKGVEEIRQYVIERRKKERNTDDAIKRGVMQIIKGLGWIK